MDTYGPWAIPGIESADTGLKTKNLHFKIWRFVSSSSLVWKGRDEWNRRRIQEVEKRGRAETDVLLAKRGSIWWCTTLQGVGHHLILGDRGESCVYVKSILSLVQMFILYKFIYNSHCCKPVPMPDSCCKLYPGSSSLDYSSFICWVVAIGRMLIIWAVFHITECLV